MWLIAQGNANPIIINYLQFCIKRDQNEKLKQNCSKG